MDVGIIGLTGSGKTTIFNYLTGGRAEPSSYGPSGDHVNVGVAKVPDSRLQGLAGIFQPKRLVPAEVRYVDVPFAPRELGKSEGFKGVLLDQLSKVDALLHVVRSFKDPSVPHIEGSIDPKRDVDAMNLELAYSDLAILERRRERIELSLKGAASSEREALLKERGLIDKIENGLERGVGILEQSLTPEEHKILRNYQFLMAKPMLLVLNIGEQELPRSTEMEQELKAQYFRQSVKVAVVSGKLEHELSQLDEADAQIFRSAMEAGEPAIDRILTLSYQVLGLISFFTTASGEVKAWSVPSDTEAARAAGKIHSDMERGFIRAEVIGYHDLAQCGSTAEAKKRGLLRLEGKNYKVQDGDVITFLFNV